MKPIAYHEYSVEIPALFRGDIVHRDLAKMMAVDYATGHYVAPTAHERPEVCNGKTRALYECPMIRRGVYSSSRYFSSSSVSVLPLASSASSILFSELKPMMGDAMRLLIHAKATVLMLQPFFFANSSTRSTVFLSFSVKEELPLFFSPCERIVSPKADAGRAR